MILRPALCALLCLGLPLTAKAQTMTATGAEVAAFANADRNKDQKLSQAEFKTFVQFMAKAGQPTARKIRFFGAYAYAFKVVDKNRDGQASPQELRSGDDTHRAAN